MSWNKLFKVASEVKQIGFQEDGDAAEYGGGGGEGDETSSTITLERLGLPKPILVCGAFPNSISVGYDMAVSSPPEPHSTIAFDLLPSFGQSALSWPGWPRSKHLRG